MGYYKIFLFTILLLVFVACEKNSKTVTPLDTLKSYQNAVKNKDVTQMKLLLSSGSIQIHQQEAKAQGLTLDDIVLRDTLFSPDQRVFGYRNETIEGEKASIEVKNNIGGYDVIYLLLEGGVWKIDKKETSNQMIQQVNDPINDLENQMNEDRQKVEDSLEDSETPNPLDSPEKPTVSPNPSESPINSDPNSPDISSIPPPMPSQSPSQ